MTFLEKLVYLDNSATTKPCRSAVEYVRASMEEEWGNPSSLHSLGMNAQIGVDECRQEIARLIHSSQDEVYFTGSGTEANNTAILGAAQAGKKRGKRIVTTAVEHPSVLNTVKRLEEQGFEVVYLKPQKNGVVCEEELQKAITADTVLVSMMLVNNELGSVMPVKKAVEFVKQVNAPALIHCDAVQAFGKMPISVKELGVDLLTASGHKIHGPKGIGFLYVKKSVHIPALITGGGQEKNLRSGTEAVPLIRGLLGALKELGNIEKQLEKQKELWIYAKEKLKNTGFVQINSSEDVLPFILNISVSGYRSEILLHFLESKNIFVSSGSACAKGEGSYVLRECGFDRKSVDSALRISFSRENSEQDIDILAEALTAATKKLRKAN